MQQPCLVVDDVKWQAGKQEGRVAAPVMTHANYTHSPGHLYCNGAEALDVETEDKEEKIGWGGSEQKRERERKGH